MRLYRSALFVPCDNAKAMAKAPGLICDLLIFDLEDAVAAEDWAGALAALVQRLEAGGISAPYRLVRIQPQHTAATFDALAHLMRSEAINGVVVPKVESAEDLVAVREALPHTLDVWAMIETPKGIVNLADIAAQPLTGLIAGPNDMRKGLRTRAMDGRQDILFALSQVVLYARANGLIALDGVYNQYTDEVGLVNECIQGRSLGFDGKTLIHPWQIGTTNLRFLPSDAEVEWAKAVVEAFDNSSAAVIAVKGEMVERLHLEQARDILSALRR